MFLKRCARVTHLIRGRVNRLTNTIFEIVHILCCIFWRQLFFFSEWVKMGCIAILVCIILIKLHRQNILVPKYGSTVIGLTNAIYKLIPILFPSFAKEMRPLNCSIAVCMTKYLVSSILSHNAQRATHIFFLFSSITVCVVKQ